MHGPYARGYVFPGDPSLQRRSPFPETRAPLPDARDSRSVTPPLPRSPSPSYVSLAERSSSHVSDPSTSRKLLILDLNGTLLFRSGHMLRPKGRLPFERAHDESGRRLPRLRPVHPRPYMPTFRSYLFAPQTKAWLDVMVWSSAQPHSVADMVDKCFGEDKGKLLAVWARDTLGLSEDHYSRKVQTVKDLAKPWAQLSSLNSELPPSPHSSEASTPHSSHRSLSPVEGQKATRSDVSPQAHSALTTLLLDDSPRKAELQPYNHVCIGEYSGERRAKDLENFQAEKDWEMAVSVWRQPEQNGGTTEEDSAGDKAAKSSAGEEMFSPRDSSEPGPEADADASRKRKRKEKKLKKRAARLEGMDVSKPDTHFDETLLAVVGVLDEIKGQSNVAAWIRTGGLWGPEDVVGSHGRTVPPTGGGSAAAASNFTIDADTLDLRAEKGNNVSVKEGGSTGIGHALKAKKQKRAAAAATAKGTITEGGNATSAPLPASTSGSIRGQSRLSDTSDNSRATPAPMLWFDHLPTVEFWAGRGRTALERLRIPVEHGIER
ncbi:hypothetical protein BKA93DRAFT_721428 [Sparassis latifolia]